MSLPSWNDLLVFPTRTSSHDDLKRVAQASDQYSTTLCFGIAAIGRLLANTAQSGKLSEDTVSNIGWLLDSLGTLSAQLADTQQEARYLLSQTAPTED